MPEDDHTTGGHFARKVSDGEILAAIERVDEPVVTAAELADGLPIGRRALRDRLSALRERGVVDRKTVGARAVVWWLTGEGTEDADGADSLADRIGGFGMFADDESFVEEVERVGEELDRGFEERQRDLFRD
jgi:predicted ArsR family transcriptional regulator